jgi:hypothetical protein
MIFQVENPEDPSVQKWPVTPAPCDPNSVYEVNRQLADMIGAEAKSDPQSIYFNKFVGLANGRVAVIAESWDDLMPRLLRIEPDRSKLFVFEASRDYGKVCVIWGIC